MEWHAKNISAIVLSVLVSLTSSVDRGCGASLYMVLFAVLLDLPFRTAIAMTAFTVFCGSLAPAIASMSEPHVTERGVVALADYAGALILLPTMFYGLSWGVIVNMWFPNWLLALLWVMMMSISNLELLYSYVRMRRISREAGTTLHDLLHLDDQHQANQTAGQAVGATAVDASGRPSAQSEGGHAAAAAMQGSQAATFAANNTTSMQPAGNTLGTTPGDARPQHNTKDVVITPHTSSAVRDELLNKLTTLRDAAEQIESVALLYPALHTPTFQGLLDTHCDGSDQGIIPVMASGTTSTLQLLQDDETHFKEIIRQRLWAKTKFALKWKDWWRLQNHFELALIFKVVVLHLVTEALRHRLSKPCTTRFWIMLVVVAGCVTIFLVFVSVSYSRRRLWRGEHWTDALELVTSKKKAEASQKQQSAAAGVHAGDDLNDRSVTVSDAVTVQMPEDETAKQGSYTDTTTTTAAAAAAKGEQKQRRKCCSNFGKNVPWKWNPYDVAISNISACNSRDQYKSWTLNRLITAAVVTLAVGILGCALGLPGGPMMAFFLLRLGLKPHVVAGTTRFIVLCFYFGTFVAYVISGGLHRQLAAAFALLNLGLAPLGLVLFNRLRLKSQYLLLLSSLMGLTGVCAVLVYQLVPLIASVAGRSGSLPQHLTQHASVQASVAGSGNMFDISRFCSGGH